MICACKQINLHVSAHLACTFFRAIFLRLSSLHLKHGFHHQTLLHCFESPGAAWWCPQGRFASLSTVVDHCIRILLAYKMKTYFKGRLPTSHPSTLGLSRSRFIIPQEPAWRSSLFQGWETPAQLQSFSSEFVLARWITVSSRCTQGFVDSAISSPSKPQRCSRGGLYGGRSSTLMTQFSGCLSVEGVSGTLRMNLRSMSMMKLCRLGMLVSWTLWLFALHIRAEVSNGRRDRETQQHPTSQLLAPKLIESVVDLADQSTKRY
jgi:hypothetical protein